MLATRGNHVCSRASLSGRWRDGAGLVTMRQPELGTSKVALASGPTQRMYSFWLSMLARAVTRARRYVSDPPTCLGMRNSPLSKMRMDDSVTRFYEEMYAEGRAGKAPSGLLG